MQVTREITIRRREPGTGQISSDLAANAVTKISSVFKNDLIYNPFSESPVEEKKYLPKVTNIDPESKDWREKADQYWKEFEVKVNEEGPILNLTTNSDGEPVNVKDFVTFRFAYSHPRVAQNEESMRADTNKWFYIYDPDKVKVKKNISVLLKRDAYTKFAELSTGNDNEKILTRILRMKGINPDFMSKVDIENAVSEIVDEDPQGFLDVAGDRDLKVKAILEEMVEKNVVNRIGQNYLFGEINLGASMQEAVLFIKNPANSETLNILKAKLSESRKSLPDPVMPEPPTVPRIEEPAIGAAV
jgi:hypothetical protein